MQEVRPRVPDEHERAPADRVPGVAPGLLRHADRVVLIELQREERNRRDDEHRDQHDRDRPTRSPGRHHARSRSGCRAARRWEGGRSAPTPRRTTPTGRCPRRRSSRPGTPRPRSSRAIVERSRRRNQRPTAATARPANVPNRKIGRLSRLRPTPFHRVAEPVGGLRPTGRDALRAEPERVERVGEGDGELGEAPGDVTVVQQRRDRERQEAHRGPQHRAQERPPASPLDVERVEDERRGPEHRVERAGHEEVAETQPAGDHRPTLSGDGDRRETSRRTRGRARARRGS